MAMIDFNLIQWFDIPEKKSERDKETTSLSGTWAQVRLVEIHSHCYDLISSINLYLHQLTHLSNWTLDYDSHEL